MVDHNAIILRNLFELSSQGNDLPWQPFREGVEIYPIYNSPGGCSAALLRYAAGAVIPKHTHVGYEHILILDGMQQDEHDHYPRGSLMINPPGTQHTVESKAGCIVLAIWEKPVKFI